MIAPPRPRRPVVVAVTVAAVALVVAAFLVTHRPARGRLVASDPFDRASVTGAPTGVRLTFSEAPDPGLSHVTVWAGRVSVDSGPLSRDGSDGLRQPVDIRSAGDFTITYHVVFASGTEDSGELSFRVGAGSAPPPAAAPQAGATDGQHDHGVDPLSGVLIAADVIVLLGVIVLLRIRPAPRRRSTASGGR